MNISRTKTNIILIVLIMLQLIAALCFCARKQGFHYDENYSYYSSNVTYGLSPGSGEWLDSRAISDEFMVTEGKGFEYGMVTLMQTYDVHPPMYYYVLHTVCSLTPGIFSKWQGLVVNITFFVLGLICLTAICRKVTDNSLITIFTVALYGFSPAIISGITFIRMYVMLTFLCFLSLLIHLRGLDRANRGIRGFIVPVFVTTYIGFMTHYYFIVFLFFEAAFMTLFLFFKEETRKESYIYAGTVIGAMLLEVLTYPACLKHIFRGYRGTEAIGSFFDIYNLKERAGLFVGLLQEYLLCNTFYFLLLILLVGYVTVRGMRSGNSKTAVSTGDSAADNTSAENMDRSVTLRIAFVGIVVAGYFSVVLKTALQNAEEAVRYEMPVYGLIILLIVLGIFTLFKGKMLAAVIIMMLTLACQFVGLKNDKVLFLYPEEKEEVEFASGHRDDDIVYIYNPVTQWMIWDNAHELEKYRDIFFIDMGNTDAIVDNRVCGSGGIIAYVMRYEDADRKLDEIIAANTNITNKKLLEERMFVDIYELR